MNRGLSIILRKAMNAADICMTRLISSSKFLTMKVHISLMMCMIHSKTSIDQKFQSIYEIPFL